MVHLSLVRRTGLHSKEQGQRDGCIDSLESFQLDFSSHFCPRTAVRRAQIYHCAMAHQKRSINSAPHEMFCLQHFGQRTAFPLRLVSLDGVWRADGDLLHLMEGDECDVTILLGHFEDSIAVLPVSGPELVFRAINVMDGNV